MGEIRHDDRPGYRAYVVMITRRVVELDLGCTISRKHLIGYDNISKISGENTLNDMEATNELQHLVVHGGPESRLVWVERTA